MTVLHARIDHLSDIADVTADLAAPLEGTATPLLHDHRPASVGPVAAHLAAVGRVPTLAPSSAW